MHATCLCGGCGLRGRFGSSVLTFMHSVSMSHKQSVCNRKKRQANANSLPMTLLSIHGFSDFPKMQSAEGPGSSQGAQLLATDWNKPNSSFSLCDTSFLLLWEQILVILWMRHLVPTQLHLFLCQVFLSVYEWHQWHMEMRVVSPEH